MNGHQMQFLADEYADRMMSQLKPTLASLCPEDQGVVRQALKVTFLDGFGRGMSEVTREVNAGVESILLKRQAG